MPTSISTPFPNADNMWVALSMDGILKRKVFFGDVVIYTLTQWGGEVENHAPFFTFLERFLICLEENGPRIRLAKHSCLRKKHRRSTEEALKKHWRSTEEAPKNHSESRHAPLLLLHKQAHDKRGIAESVHAQITRARLTVCEVGAFSSEISQLSKIRPHPLLGAT